MILTENEVLPLSAFALQLQAEGLRVDRETLGVILHPLRIVPKRMSNGRAKGLDDKDRERVRRFFRKGVKALN